MISPSGRVIVKQRRREFSAEFRGEAVQMAIGSDESIAAVARQIGMNEGTLSKVLGIGHKSPAPPRAHPHHGATYLPSGEFITHPTPTTVIAYAGYWMGCLMDLNFGLDGR
jgi:Transposase